MILIRPLLRWLRTWIWPIWFLPLLIVAYVAFEVQYLRVLGSQLGTNLFDVRAIGGLRDSITLILIFVAGALRVKSHHPFFWVEFGQWLARTPWQVSKTLPLGPIHLAVGDIVFLAVMVLLLHNPYVSLFRVPLCFLGGYLTLVCVSFWTTGTKKHAYALTFGLGLVARLWMNPEAATVVAALLYVVAWFGLRQSLAGFPWSKAELLASRVPILQLSLSKIIMTTDLRDLVRPKPLKSLGWPFELLRPNLSSAAIGLREAAIVSLLIAWWVYAIAANPMDPDVRSLFLLMGLSSTTFTLAIFRLGLYCTSYSPPINLWGRLFALRWIVPGYDQVFLAPLLAVVLDLAAIGTFQELKLDPLLVIPAAVACTMMILLGVGPSLQDWRLTGHHRISPSDKTKALLRI